MHFTAISYHDCQNRLENHKNTCQATAPQTQKPPFRMISRVQMRLFFFYPPRIIAPKNEIFPSNFHYWFFFVLVLSFHVRGNTADSRKPSDRIVNRKAKRKGTSNLWCYRLLFISHSHEYSVNNRTSNDKTNYSITNSSSTNPWTSLVINSFKSITRQKGQKKGKMSKTNGHAEDSHAEDKLIEVPQYSLIKLRNMFKANWPTHITAYYLIENYMEWLEKVNNIKNLKIFSLNGEWRKDGTFVIIVSAF